MFLCILPVIKLSSCNTQKTSMLWIICKLCKMPLGNKTRECQSLVLSDQVLLDIVNVESVMFNIRFICLKIGAGMWDFRFSIMTQNTMRTQYRYKSNIAKESNCSAQLSHSTSVVPSLSLMQSPPPPWASLALLGVNV